MPFKRLVRACAGLFCKPCVALPNQTKQAHKAFGGAPQNVDNINGSMNSGDWQLLLHENKRLGIL